MYIFFSFLFTLEPLKTGKTETGTETSINNFQEPKPEPKQKFSLLQEPNRNRTSKNHKGFHTRTTMFLSPFKPKAKRKTV